MRALWHLLALGLLIFTATAAFAQRGPEIAPRQAHSRPVPGRFIVTLQERVDPRAVARDHGIEPDFVYTHVITGFAGSMSDLAHSGLLRDNRIVRVEQDRTVDATQSAASWGLDRIDQHALPLSGTYTPAGTGRGVTAYVVDSGIRFDHQEFGGRAVRGTDTVGDGQNGNDCNGHGTHVAGTIGGSTYGVAREVSLVAVRVLDCDGSGYVSGIIAGMDWIVANGRRPGVVNMSLGGDPSTTSDSAVQRLVSAGFTVVVAAGNESVDACTESPSRAPAAITVAAADRTDTRPSFSNFGSCVDIFAPGVSISSAWNTSPTAAASASGTSMASPHVAGVAALLLQANPQLTPAGVASALRSNATANVVSDAGGPNNYLLYSAPATAPAPAPAPAPIGGTSTTGDTMTTSQTYVQLPDNIANVTYTGTAPFTAVGNALNNTFRGGPDRDYLIGYGGNDTFFGMSGGANTLQGGPGNDLYLVEAGDSIVEMANEGLDQAQTWLPYYELPANVEELIHSGSLAFTGLGNAIANRIVGGAGADFVSGRGGDDVLSGAGGQDVFGYPGADGFDQILDFNAGTAGSYDDRIDLRGRGLTFSSLIIQSSTVGGAAGTLITLPGGDRIFLAGVAPGAVGPEDFAF